MVLVTQYLNGTGNAVSIYLIQGPLNQDSTDTVKYQFGQFLSAYFIP
jgi:hypothetical protein